MTSPQQLEILDLRHFNARQLRPLLEEEAELWNRRLRWNYTSSTELLLQYLDSRILPGFVALDRGRICGFCFCVYEGHKAVIGDIYTSRNAQAPSTVTYSLTRHLLEVLEASPGTERIETQLLLFDEGVLPSLFAAAISRDTQLHTHKRLFLELELPSAPPAPGQHFPSEIELCRWSPSLYPSTAELIQLAYTGHLDSDINDQYRTLAGSQRFLHNIIRFPGCGTFDPASSFVLRERSSGMFAAVILCSRVAPDTAHVTQLCVAPAFRGSRLGETLLRFTLDHLAGQNYRFLTLTVSEANTSALRLYNATGFRTRHRFDALVLEKLSHPARIFPFK